MRLGVKPAKNEMERKTRRLCHSVSTSQITCLRALGTADPESQCMGSPSPSVRRSEVDILEHSTRFVIHTDCTSKHQDGLDGRRMGTLLERPIHQWSGTRGAVGLPGIEIAQAEIRMHVDLNWKSQCSELGAGHWEWVMCMLATALFRRSVWKT